MAQNLVDREIIPQAKLVYNFLFILFIKIRGLMATELRCLQISNWYNVISPISRAICYILGNVIVLFQLTSLSSSFLRVKLPVLSIWSRSSTDESSEKTMGSPSVSVALMTATDEPEVSSSDRMKRHFTSKEITPSPTPPKSRPQAFFFLFYYSSR